MHMHTHACMDADSISDSILVCPVKRRSPSATDSFIIVYNTLLSYFFCRSWMTLVGRTTLWRTSWCPVDWRSPSMWNCGSSSMVCLHCPLMSSTCSALSNAMAMVHATTVCIDCLLESLIGLRVSCMCAQSKTANPICPYFLLVGISTGTS